MFTTIYGSLLDWNEVPTTLIYLCIIIFLLGLKCKQKHDSKSLSSIRVADKLGLNNIKPMPSPPTMPIIGHIHLLRDHQHNPWDGFDEIRKEFGDVVGLKMGIHQMALVSNCEFMREILLKKGDIFSNRPNFPRHHIIFGGDKENSLALCNWSSIHRDRRKFCKRGIVPNRFSSRNQLLETIIIRLVAKFVDKIDKQEPTLLSHNNNNNNSNKSTPSPEMDATIGAERPHFIVTKEDILFLTSDIFMDFLCNESYAHSDPEYRDFVYGCDFVFWDINQSYLIDFLPFLTSLGLGFSYLKRLKRVTDFLRDFIDDKIFEPRRQKHIESCKKGVDKFKGVLSEHTNEEDEEEKSEDYLDTIIAEHLSEVTSMSLADYKVGFADLLAGHAAVANILIRLLGHLALDETIQEMICKEAERADIYNLTHKPSLPMTEAAMQEALRIASSPIVPHVAREDTCIDKFYVPQGTMVLFNNYHLNLSETLWDKPYDFNPMRFLETCSSNTGQTTFKLNVPKHFMPFSVGMRQCLGYKMVETTTIVAVANLCRKYIIKPTDEALVRRLLAPKGSIALNPDSECFGLKLYPR